ncbi:photosystem I reaction center subunit XII [Prochlorococcus sp. MIT 1223]|uniref:photosystem I reaction center subunit XII n=1 Tax=Prochlorococcus sp. MIT 1223 TaxID=3096217 RepID=UPI002A75F04A|nr:photosystem I reaction center subunit XII [Prochlorococcus sp. MIT 1223]|tara:strand:- start:87 stop:257 length:171 start_codon:yes stop_codon:yes gene_type:complete
MQQLIFFAERMPSDLSKVDFSSGFNLQGPDLAGISLLLVTFAGVLALRLGTSLRDT